MTGFRFISSRGLIAIGLLSSIALLMTGCDSGTAAPAQKTAPGTSVGQTTTEVPQAEKLFSKVDCDALQTASTHFGQGLSKMVSFAPDTNYSGYAEAPADSPFHLDFTMLRKDLDTLATLPDTPGEAQSTFGKPSESIAYFRQLVDVAESDLKAQGNPFKDTGADGRKVIGMDTPWASNFTALGVAIGKACGK